MLAEILVDRPEPGELIYLERRGDRYAWRRIGVDTIMSTPDEAVELPDAWIFYGGTWPEADRRRATEMFDDLLAEMESLAGGGGDRCRWSPDDPWPRGH